MSGYRVASAYAKALLGLSEEQKILEKVFDDMTFVEKVLLSHRELRLVLSSPIVHLAQKEKILFDVFKTKVQTLSMLFLNMVIKKHREGSLLGIAQQFIKEYKSQKGIQTATLTTVVDIPAKTQKDIVGLLSQITNKKIELELKKDSSLIGGFVLSTQDKQIDSSVRSKLHKIKQNISSRTIVS